MDQIDTLRLLGIKLGDLINKETYEKNSIMKYRRILKLSILILLCI